MAANVNPVFSLTPNIGRVAAGGTANTSALGTGTVGTDIFKAFTAGANGSWVSKVRFTPVASVASTAVTATTLRVFVSSITSGATTGSTDTFNIGELSAAAQTADVSGTAILPLEFPLSFALNASQTILVTSHVVNAANTSWHVTVFGGDY